MADDDPAALPVVGDTEPPVQERWWSVNDSLGLLIAVFVYEAQAILFANEHEGATVSHVAGAARPLLAASPVAEGAKQRTERGSLPGESPIISALPLENTNDSPRTDHG